MISEENIVKLRTRLNLSQIELGNILDMSPQTVARWELGSKKPSFQQEMIFLGLQKLIEENGDKLDTEKIKNMAQTKGGLSHLFGMLGGSTAATIGAAAVTGFFLPVILGAGTVAILIDSIISYFQTD